MRMIIVSVESPKREQLDHVVAFRIKTRHLGKRRSHL